MQRFKYVAELVKKKKEKTETGEPSSESHVPENLENSKPDQPSSSLKEDPPQTVSTELTEKQSVVRQNSSSSNNSGSEQDWCIVEGSSGS